MRVYGTIPDAAEVLRYYRDMAEGKLKQPTQRTDIGFGRQRKKLFERRGYSDAYRMKNTPIVKLVTPVAMAAEQARAKLDQSAKNKKAGAGPRKKKKKKTGSGLHKKKPRSIRSKKTGSGLKKKTSSRPIRSKNGRSTSIKSTGRRKRRQSTSRSTRDNFSR